MREDGTAPQKQKQSTVDKDLKLHRAENNFLPAKSSSTDGTGKPPWVTICGNLWESVDKAF